MAAAADEVPEYAPELTQEEQELVQGLQDCIDHARHRANKHWPPDVAEEMVQALLSKAKVGSYLVCTVLGCSTAWVVPVKGPTSTGLRSKVKVDLLAHLCISGLQDCMGHASQTFTKQWLASVAQAMLQVLLGIFKTRSCFISCLGPAPGRTSALALHWQGYI